MSCGLTDHVCTHVANESLRTGAGIIAGTRHAGGTVPALVLVAGFGWHVTGGTTPPVLTVAEEVRQ